MTTQLIDEGERLGLIAEHDRLQGYTADNFLRNADVDEIFSVFHCVLYRIQEWRHKDTPLIVLDSEISQAINEAKEARQ